MPATLVLHQLCFLSITILQDAAATDLGDLGKQLLGGFVLAVVVAVAYAFIKIRLRDQKPAEQFISISSFKGTEEATKVSPE
jgi:hypothetical protein